MQLRADTRVTNHGFVDGHATALQSVLQAGTAVLVDDHGRPRVKCGCGNPLLDPVATPITPSYTGDALARLQPAQRVRRHACQAARSTGSSSTTSAPAETFYRPRGTDGDQDQPTTPPRGDNRAPPPDHPRSCLPAGSHLRARPVSPTRPPGPARLCPAGQVLDGGQLRADPGVVPRRAAIPPTTAPPATPTNPTAPTDSTATATAPVFPTVRRTAARRARTRRARSASPTTCPPARTATTSATPTNASKTAPTATARQRATTACRSPHPARPASPTGRSAVNAAHRPDDARVAAASDASAPVRPGDAVSKRGPAVLKGQTHFIGG